MRVKNAIIVTMLILTLLVTICVPANAEDVDEVVPSRLTYINTYSSSITHGTFSTTVKASVSGKSSVTKIKIKMELQKEKDGAYSTVKTWEETFYSRNAYKEESKATSPTATYRLKTTITVYAGSNSETIYTYAY